MCLTRPPATTTTSGSACSAIRPAISSSASSDRGSWSSTTLALVDELRRQPVLGEPADPEPLGVRLERPLAEQPVLVRADPGEPVPRDRTERQRAVVIADDDDAVRPLASASAGAASSRISRSLASTACRFGASRSG